MPIEFKKGKIPAPEHTPDPEMDLMGDFILGVGKILDEADKRANAAYNSNSYPELRGLSPLEREVYIVRRPLSRSRIKHPTPDTDQQKEEPSH